MSITQIQNIPNPKTQSPNEFEEKTTNFLNEDLPRFINETNSVANDINNKHIDIYNKWVVVTNQAVDGGYSQSYIDGMFNKIWNGLTFYVDAENGDDANDGSSSHPFRTIKKAIETTPVGGSVTITFTSDTTDDNEIKQVNITEEHYCDIVGKNVTFKITPNTNLIFNSRTESYNTKGYFSLVNSNVIFSGYGDNRSITLKAKDSSVNWSYLGRWSLFECNNSFVGFNFYKYNKIIFEDNSPSLVSVTNRDYYGGFSILKLYSTDCIFDMSGDSHSYLIELYGGTGSIAFTNYALHLKDTEDNSVALSDVISGIVKDSNGVPRNFISNTVI